MYFLYKYTLYKVDHSFMCRYIVSVLHYYTTLTNIVFSLEKDFLQSYLRVKVEKFWYGLDGCLFVVGDTVVVHWLRIVYKLSTHTISFTLFHIIKDFAVVQCGGWRKECACWMKHFFSSHYKFSLTKTLLVLEVHLSTNSHSKIFSL